MIAIRRTFGPLKALVLDWAGTAVDYGCLGPMDVFVQAFAKHGIPIEVAEARAPMGLKKIDHVRGVLTLPAVTQRFLSLRGHAPGEDDVRAIYADTEGLMIEAVSHHAELIPGLLETMAFCRSQGMKIGSSTGYTSAMMDVVAPLAAAQGYVPDAIVCSDQVPAGRPTPFMCFQNALLLEVFPLSAMVKIGDTVADIQEGLSAGMWTIGLTRSGNELGLTKAEADALPAQEMSRRLQAIETRFLDAGVEYVAESIADCPAILTEINDRLASGERP